MLTVDHLSVSYGQHRALDDVSVKIAKGEVAVILGANGAGKSSLLRAIAGLSEGHAEGDISFNGVSLIGLSPDEIVTAGIALVPEGRAIFGDLNVEENLRLGAYSERARANEAANLDRVLTLFPKLRERRKQITRTMSGGEQQMVAVGRALMSDPTILMLDEPSLGLSPILSKELFQALGQIRETGPGVLVVEQNAKLSLAIADRGYLIENGHIVGENDAVSLAADPAVQAAYLGGDGRTGVSAPRPVMRPASLASPTPAAVPVSSPASSSDRVFVTPAGLDANAGTTSSLIGETLDGLLDRASDAARPTDGPDLSQQSDVPRIVEITHEPASTQPAVPEPTVSYAALGNDRITAMLAEFESAAERARRPRPQPIHRSTAGPGSPPRPDPRDETLPEIPVFKKARVEIYRRDNSGALVKAKEV